MPRSIPFAPKLIPHYIGGICEVWVQPLFLNHDFHFSPHTPPSHKIKSKEQYHQTWLSTNHTKINSCCSQTFPISLWRHLTGLSPSSFKKAWFFVFLPRQHQITKSNQNTKITKLGLTPTIPTSIPFAPNLFPHHFGGICEVWVQPDFKNHDFCYSPHTPPSHKIKPKHQNHQNLVIQQPYQDQFLLLPTFSHITLEAFVRIEYSHISKTLTFVFHPSHHQVTRSSQNTKITKFGYTTTRSRTIPFVPKLFPHQFEGIWEVWDQPHFQNHDFHFWPHPQPSHNIHPNHQTWLCTNYAKINSFYLQTFPTSL